MNTPNVSPQTSAQITAQVTEVQKRVRAATGLELKPEEIVHIHMCALEPDVLAKSIIYGVTRNPIELAEPGEMPEELVR